MPAPAAGQCCHGRLLWHCSLQGQPSVSHLWQHWECQVGTEMRSFPGNWPHKALHSCGTQCHLQVLRDDVSWPQPVAIQGKCSSPEESKLVRSSPKWLCVNPDAAALLSTGPSGGARGVHLDALLPDASGPQGPCLCCQRPCSLRERCNSLAHSLGSINHSKHSSLQLMPCLAVKVVLGVQLTLAEWHLWSRQVSILAVGHGTMTC